MTLQHIYVTSILQIWFYSYYRKHVFNIHNIIPTNFVISAAITKSMAIAATPVGCVIEVDDKTVGQVMKPAI